MSLLDDVGNFITAPFTSAAEGVAKVWNAVGGLFDLTKGVFLHVGDAWSLVVNGASHMWESIESVAESAYHAVAHVVTYTIPHSVLWAVAKAEHAASVALHDVEKVLSHLIDRLHVLLIHTARAIEHALSKAVKFIIGRINVIVHWIEHTAKRAVEIVLHPERLVTWILPHLILPLLKFVIREAAALVKWLVQHAIGIIHEVAPEIEAAITELI